jgi:Tektin family
VTKKICQRIGDVTYWKNEAQNEMDKMSSEIEALTKSKCCLERALAETDNLVYIAQECLYHREKRQGIDQVHDDVENLLILVRRSTVHIFSYLLFLLSVLFYRQMVALFRVDVQGDIDIQTDVTLLWQV